MSELSSNGINNDPVENSFDHAVWDFSKEHCKNVWKVEWQIFKRNYGWILLGLFWQWVHSVGTNIVYWLHVQGPRLRDLGFDLLPELSGFWTWVNEILVYSLFAAAAGFLFSPFFIRRSKGIRISSMLMMKKMCLCFVYLQTLRIVSFLVTILPGPAPHCQPGSDVYNPPSDLWEIMTRMDATFGCGDLIFSSHTTFIMMFVMLFWEYSLSRTLKYGSVAVVCLVVPFTVMSRKHYTIDIWIAVYVVPMVWMLYEKVFPKDDVVRGRYAKLFSDNFSAQYNDALLGGF